MAEDGGELLHHTGVLVGAKRRPDGTLDTSRALRMLPITEEGGRIQEKKPPVVPPNWTTLYHGTNLARHQWQGKEDTLNQATFTVEGMGLSAISEQERQEQIEQSRDPRTNYNTTENYSQIAPSGSSGQSVEIRVIVPVAHSRRSGHKEVLAEYAARYSKQRAKEILKLSDVIFWENQQNGRHPIVPSGMVLDKLDDRTKKNGVRSVTYIPDELKDVYQEEVQRIKDEKIKSPK